MTNSQKVRLFLYGCSFSMLVVLSLWLHCSLRQLLLARISLTETNPKGHPAMSENTRDELDTVKDIVALMDSLPTPDAVDRAVAYLNSRYTRKTGATPIRR